MEKKSFLKKSGIAGAAIVLGAMGISATKGQEDLRDGVLMSKDEKTATVRDCATGDAVTLAYGNSDAKTFLIGESIGYEYKSALLIKHYPDRQACFFHS